METKAFKEIVEGAIQKHNEKEASKTRFERFIDHISHWWQWRDGRRTKVGGYKVMTLIDDIGPWRWWLGIIRYRKGDFQPLHCDPLHKGTKGHFKINIELWPAKGSDFITMLHHFNFGPLHIFWAHHNPHEVTPVEKGTRYVLSFSVWTKEFKEDDSNEYLKKCYEHQQKMVKRHESLKEKKHWDKILGERYE